MFIYVGNVVVQVGNVQVDEEAVEFLQRKWQLNGRSGPFKSNLHKDFHEHFCCPSICPDGTKCVYDNKRVDEMEADEVIRIHTEETRELFKRGIARLWFTTEGHVEFQIGEQSKKTFAQHEKARPAFWGSLKKSQNPVKASQNRVKTSQNQAAKKPGAQTNIRARARVHRRKRMHRCP